MASQKKERRELGKQLEVVRAEQRDLLTRVEKARRKFEKRSVKLRSLEKRIVEIQQELRRLSGSDGVTDHLRQARLIFNPKSGGNTGNPNALEDMVVGLRAHGIDAQIGIKTSGKASRELAREAAENGEDLVIVAGGDGTIEDVASQLIGSQTTLGIVPVGTMNNLARSLGIPLELEAAYELIGAGVPRRIDVGHVQANEKPQVEFFMETAGIGLTAIAFPAGQAAKKGRLGGLPDAIKKLLDFRASPIMIELDNGETVQSQSQLITVSNAPLLGLNFMIAPGAKMDDGLLDLAVYDEMNKAEILAYFMAITNGKPADNAKIRRYCSRKIRVRSARHEPVVSDKDEVADKKDFEIEVVPGALSVIVGDGIGLSRPMLTEAAEMIAPAKQETTQ